MREVDSTVKEILLFYLVHKLRPINQGAQKGELLLGHIYQKRPIFTRTNPWKQETSIC
jgi:hypothetical protein